MTRIAQQACQICYPMPCREPWNHEPQMYGHVDYIVCPNCGSDTLKYETERSIEDAYLRCACGWSEYERLV